MSPAGESADAESLPVDDRDSGCHCPSLNDRSGAGSKISRTSSPVSSESSSGVSRGAPESAV